MAVLEYVHWEVWIDNNQNSTFEKPVKAASRKYHCLNVKRVISSDCSVMKIYEFLLF